MDVVELRKSLQVFGVQDCVVFVFMLLICAIIGIYFYLQMRLESLRPEDNEDFNAASSYLVGGRKMKIFPITMSLIASFISGITLLGTPTEVYLYGMQYIYIIVSLVLMGLCMHYLFLPVFHDLNLISTYKYLEARFDRRVRLFGSVMFIIGSIFWLPIVIFVPAMAFNQATGVNIHVVTPLVCVICIFYTCIGGLKAVVWTDVVQTLIMFGAMAIILIKGTVEIGGVGVVLDRALETARIEAPNFKFDLMERYTAYSLFIGGVANWLKSNAINQNMIQRYLALPTLRDARIAAWAFILGVSLFIVVCGYTGLLLYATYWECDPITTKLALHKDQLVPLLVMQTLGTYPGLPGLFVAGVFSAALSSLSTGLNSISAVVLEDFVKPFRHQPLTESQTSWIMRGVVIIAGAVFVSLVAVVERLGTVLQLTTTLSSISNGPLLGIFVSGVMIPWVTARGAFVGGILSVLVMLWMCISSQMDLANHGFTDIRKAFSTAGCDYNYTMPELVNTTLLLEPDNTFHLYRISFLYLTLFGMIVTILIALVISYVFGDPQLDDVDPRLLSPFVRRWLERRLEEKSVIATDSNVQLQRMQITELPSMGNINYAIEDTVM